MKTEYQITEKMQELNANLSAIEERLQVELKKHHSKRDFRLLWFLDKERKVWEYALTQLNWILSND